MKTPYLTLSLLLVGGMLHCAAQAAATTNAASATPPAVGAPPPAQPHHVLFQAPDDDSGGVLPNRVGGGSRGFEGDAPKLEVLVPDAVARTTEARPLLYWYQNKPSKVKFEISVTEPKKPKPLMLVQTNGTIPAGVHSFRVAGDLKPGVVYRWSVAAVLDPGNRSEDVVAYGVVKRIAPTDKLTSALSQASDVDKPAVYASNGIWYDAFESLSVQIQHTPNNDALKQERLSLLQQVGIGDVSFDAVPSK